MLKKEVSRFLNPEPQVTVSGHDVAGGSGLKDDNSCSLPPSLNQNPPTGWGLGAGAKGEPQPIHPIYPVVSFRGTVAAICIDYDEFL